MGVNLTAQVDDGKGRRLEKRKDVVKLVLKDWHEVCKPGDYAITDQIGTWGMECIVLLCPFCGYECPLPFLVKVECKEPLAIKDELHCGQCLKDFYILKGVAVESWGELQCT